MSQRVSLTARFDAALVGWLRATAAESGATLADTVEACLRLAQQADPTELAQLVGLSVQERRTARRRNRR